MSRGFKADPPKGARSPLTGFTPGGWLKEGAFGVGSRKRKLNVGVLKVNAQEAMRTVMHEAIIDMAMVTMRCLRHFGACGQFEPSGRIGTWTASGGISPWPI
jgi:hypothetical protein